MQQADHPEEILDLIDDNDGVIGTITRKEVYAKGVRNYRVVHAFIKNEKGELWIPKRVDTKKLWPGGLDFSIAGHVETGESYEVTLAREALEDARLDITTVQYEEVAYLTPLKHDVCAFQKVYILTSDETPDYDRSEFQSSEWLLPTDIIERAEAGVAMKSDIPKLLKWCGLV